jgi:thioredoxin 1
LKKAPLVCNFFRTDGSVEVNTQTEIEMKLLTELTADNFETEVLRAAGPVLVDFYAPWCGPCKMLAPLLEQLAGEMSGQVKFAKLNVDDASELAGRYSITGVPTLMLFRDGQRVDQMVGMAPPAALKRWLAQHAAPAVTA